MELPNEIKGYKRGSLLHFERGNKKIAFDLKDLTFYRPLKSGQMKELKGKQAFFRNLSVRTVADSFEDKIFSKLMRLVGDASYGGKAKNFATVFESVEQYKHLEGYLLLDIPFTTVQTFEKPVSIYPKEVLAFMKESGITFAGQHYWERNFEKHPKLMTDLCTHIRKNHYLDLEVYRMFHSMANSYDNFNKFALLVADPNKPFATEDYYIAREHGYGCEYKTLFSYLVRIERTEACVFSNALTLYRDYLKMMRDIERNKAIVRMREANLDFVANDVGFVGFGRVEKYPKYLKTRHDIVQKNYRDWQDTVDEKLFAAFVQKGYEYSWGGYKMVVPKKSSDVKSEGATLHHCVASYVSRIMDGTTQILFMREDEKESLVTVEVRAGAIVQARGYNNRDVTAKESLWLKTFAKAKNLSYKDVKRNENMPTPPVVALQKWDAYGATLVELSAMVKARAA